MPTRAPGFSSLLGFAAALLLAGACSRPAPAVDEDSGVAAPACVAPDGCKAAGFDGVCRQGQCQAEVPCADDVECGLGESCHADRCVFSGCSQDTDCPTGRCQRDVFSCAECAASADCPQDRPVCQASSSRCVACGTDSDCPIPGPAYCNTGTGACVHCLTDAQCPAGLSCGDDGTCHGATLNQPCPTGVSCDRDLMCVSVSGDPRCLRACDMYAPECAAGELCLKLTFADSPSLVFEQGVPLGVCHAPFTGLKLYREGCAFTATGHNCQPNLECVPTSAQAAACRGFCDPAHASCSPGEVCHAYPGDYAGHTYGLCYADNGFGDACTSDGVCRTGLSCGPAVDPSTVSGTSMRCRFSRGTAPALAPCEAVTQADGGQVPPDAVCASGLCRQELSTDGAAYYCFGACQADADCAAGGRAGTCDGDFAYGAGSAATTLRGCRPTCAAPSACAAYGAGYTCRSTLRPWQGDVELSQTCARSDGGMGLGQGCLSDSDCFSGRCALDDARGVRRAGVCVHPCASASDCLSLTGLDGGSPDGGGVGTVSGPLGCGPVAVLTDLGHDGVAGTADDGLRTTQECSGIACATDDDCGPSARCVPVPDPAAPLTGLVLRCQSPVTLALLEAGDVRTQHAQCKSGVCGVLQPPSTGAGRVCFAACGPATACDGGTVCRQGGVGVSSADGVSHGFSACAP